AASPEPSEPPAASVETPTSSSASNGGEPRSKLLELVLAGGWIGAILLVGSIFAVSLAIRLALSLRRAAFFSAEVEEAVRDALNRDDFAAALAAAEERNDAILGRVLAAGLREADRGWDAVEKGLEDAVAEETAAFYRRTEPLSTLGNVAPMLGLLGTVVGMVSTFGELAVADGSGRNLAGGIYFALITTVDGLLVAIPVLVAHAALNARGAALFAELVQRLDRLFAPAKRLLTSPSAPLAQTVQTPRTPQAAPTSRAAQTAQTPRTASSPVSESPRRSTPVAGLQEVAPTPPSRPTLSLKSKPNAAPPANRPLKSATKTVRSTNALPENLA
ncbi:MAG: MotA/TolQ/ExbB proton channel family protein, partial [Thermoguttaceae bacterium]|nr:MotA/TolQ/ExbB proton channel family protein [Thermoguttaceae bacterium]